MQEDPRASDALGASSPFLGLGNANGAILVVGGDPSRFAEIDAAMRQSGIGPVHHVLDSSEARSSFFVLEPDVILIDLDEPGFEEDQSLADFLALQDARNYVPIIGLTANASSDLRLRALSHGIADYLSEPFGMAELVLRTRTQLQHRKAHQDLATAKADLESRVRQRTREFESLHIELLERLAVAGEFRDDDTGGHTRRVATLVARIAMELGLPEPDAMIIGRASLLHDIGKIGVSDTILRKQGRLTTEETIEMRKHTSIGRRILQGSRSRLLQVAEAIAFYHHERWDGSGYKGTSGTDIPIEARIVAVADVFDALTTERPYKAAWPTHQAIKEIVRNSGGQFDPHVVEAFVRVVKRKNHRLADWPDPLQDQLSLDLLSGPQ